MIQTPGDHHVGPMWCSAAIEEDCAIYAKQGMSSIAEGRLECRCPRCSYEMPSTTSLRPTASCSLAGFGQKIGVDGHGSWALSTRIEFVLLLSRSLSDTPVVLCLGTGTDAPNPEFPFQVSRPSDYAPNQDVKAAATSLLVRTPSLWPQEKPAGPLPEVGERVIAISASCFLRHSDRSRLLSDRFVGGRRFRLSRSRRQRLHSPHHRRKQPPGQMTLGQHQPVVAGVFDQPPTCFHAPLLQAGQRLTVDPPGQHQLPLEVPQVVGEWSEWL